jgi:hypothetical protein
VGSVWKLIETSETICSHSGIAEESSLLGCDTIVGRVVPHISNRLMFNA